MNRRYGLLATGACACCVVKIMVVEGRDRQLTTAIDLLKHQAKP